MQPNIDDETLVAFLDGELPSEQKSTIEQNLQADDALRQRVSSLKASWDLLGDLPVVEPRRDLAQSTIEIVTLAMDKESRSWWQWLNQHRWASLGLAGMIMLAAGASTSRALTSFMTRQILENLPAIVEYRLLENIDTVEFLEELGKIPDLIAAADPQAGPVLIGDGVVPDDLSQRRTWLESLEEVDRGRLESNFESYHDRKKTSEQRYVELRQLTDRIHSIPSETDHLLATARAYSAILDKLGYKQKARFKQMSMAERLTEINDRVNNEMVLNYVLTNEDRAAIRSWLDDIQFKEENFDFLSFNPDPDSVIIRELLYIDSAMSFVTQDDINDLIEQRLSAEAAQLLKNLGDESAQRRDLGLWVSSAVQASAQNGTTSREADLAARFEALPKDRQDELEWMPEDEVRKLLREEQRGPPSVPPAESLPTTEY